MTVVLDYTVNDLFSFFSDIRKSDPIESEVSPDLRVLYVFPGGLKSLESVINLWILCSKLKKVNCHVGS